MIDSPQQMTIILINDVEEESVDTLGSSPLTLAIMPSLLIHFLHAISCHLLHGSSRFSDQVIDQKICQHQRHTLMNYDELIKLQHTNTYKKYSCP